MDREKIPLLTDGSQTTSDPTAEATHPQTETENTSSSVTETTHNDSPKTMDSGFTPYFLSAAVIAAGVMIATQKKHFCKGR